MLHNLYNVGSFLRYMMPSSCLKTKTSHVNKNISKRKQPGCFSFFSSFTPSPKARSYSTLPKEPSPLESSNKLTPWGKAFNSLCSLIFGTNSTKIKLPEDHKTPLLTQQEHESLPFSLIPEQLANKPPLKVNITTPDATRSSSAIRQIPSSEIKQDFVRALEVYADFEDTNLDLVYKGVVPVGSMGKISKELAQQISPSGVPLNSPSEARVSESPRNGSESPVMMSSAVEISSAVEMSSAPSMRRFTKRTTNQNPVVLVVKPFDSFPPKTQPPIHQFSESGPTEMVSLENPKNPKTPRKISMGTDTPRGGDRLEIPSSYNSSLSVIPEETNSRQGALLQEEDAPSLPSRPDWITSNKITDPATTTTGAQEQSPSDFFGFVSEAEQFLNNVASGANETARFASGLMTNITKAPLTRLDLDIVSTTNQEEDIFEIKAFNFINEELNLYNQIQLLSADKKINCYNLIISIINKDHKLFNGTITNLEPYNIPPLVTDWEQLTPNEMIRLFDQMNREKSIVAGDDDEKVKKLKIIMKILPVYLKNKWLNIKELLEEKTWPKLNSITINDELKLKALKYINEVSGSKLDISEADQTNNFDYLMGIIQGKSEEIKKAIYNPHNPRQLASDDSEMDRGSKIHLYDYLNQRLKIYTIDDDDKVQKFNLIARCIKLKRTDALTLVARDGYNKVAEITEASKDELLYTLQEAIDAQDDLVSEALKELDNSEAGRIAGTALRALEDSEVVKEASKAIEDINRVAASGVNDVKTNAIEAGHAVVIGGLDVLINAKEYGSAALGAVDSTLASGVNEITRALDGDEELPKENDLSETSFNGLSQSNPITDKENDDSKALENVIVAATQAAHSAVSDALSTFDRHVTRPFGALFNGFFPSTSPRPDLSSELSVVPRTSDSPVISDDLKFRAFQYINDVCKIEFKTTEITREENKEFIDFFDYMIRNANDVQRKILQEGTNTTIQPRSYDKSLRQEEKISLFDYLNRNLNIGIITDDQDEKVKRFDAFVNSYSERSEKFKVDFYKIKIERKNVQGTRTSMSQGPERPRGR